jgi:predicted P-loop ATPase
LRDYRVRKFAEDLKFRPTKDYFADAVSSIAAERSFHPVVDYLAGLTWDRTPRIETWLIDFAGAPDTPSVRAVSRLILIAGVARVRTPGIKFDEMLVFESPQQGTFKSSALHVLAVREEWFADGLSLAASSQQVIEQLSGKWIIESSDLSGMRKSEVENLKAFLSRQSDRARLAYGRFPVERPRGCVFFGTTNSTRYLRDESNRRFWPVRIVCSFDVAALARIRDQLWAEAAAHHAAGASIRLEPGLYDVAAAEQRLRRIEDPWVEILEVAFGDMTGRISTTDAFEIIGRPDGQRLQEDNRRVGEAMRELGWERLRTSGRGEGMGWYYVRGSTAAERRRDLYVLRGDFGGPARDPVTGRVRILDAAQLADRGIHVTPPPRPTFTPLDPALQEDLPL